MIINRHLTLKISLFLIVIVSMMSPQIAFSQEELTDPHSDDVHAEEGYDPSNTAFHHIADQNVFSLGFAQIPLPCILYSRDGGWDVFSSGRLGIGEHGNGHMAYNRYVLVEGIVRRVIDDGFPMGEVPLDEHAFSLNMEEKADGGKAEVAYLHHNGKSYKLDGKSTLDGGLLGGGLTSFYDFSLTKNVITMLLVMILLFWLFRVAAKRYQSHPLEAPKGVQSVLEPIFIFIRDDVAKPFLGSKYLRYLPFLLSLFFLILTLNFIGKIPFFGNPNVTGNLTFTLALAVVTFFVVNLNGKKPYWRHVFWMPGVPTIVMPIITIVEILGLFLKPIVLTLRLAANMTAGHIMVVIFVSLLFIFNDAGQNMAGSVPGLILSTSLTLFMMAIEILVAVVQAFVFTILAASYIGAAIEEGH